MHQASEEILKETWDLVTYWKFVPYFRVGALETDSTTFPKRVVGPKQSSARLYHDSHLFWGRVSWESGKSKTGAALQNPRKDWGAVSSTNSLSRMRRGWLV